MNNLKTTSILPVLILISSGALAYGGGGGGGSSSCAEPKFLQPNPNGEAKVLTEFRFVATDATDPATLAVEINGQKVQPEINKLGNGDYAVRVAPAQPITQPGRVRITINAKGREPSCAGFQPYYVEIKP
jgi:hypothetical protein